ncbi:MAG: hypothetical protein ACXQTI_01285 [Candidatus Nezhaarchaeales archaeon]
MGAEIEIKPSVEATKAIVYDLPSENQLVFKDAKTKQRVRNVRVLSTILLHRLGVECTQSVILVPKSNVKNIEKTVERVFKLYRDLNKELIENIGVGIDEPLIKVIDLTVKQTEDLKTLAERKLKERLDQAIERIAKLLNELDEIVEEAKRKRLIYNLNKQQKEYERLEKLASEIGLETNNKFELLTELMNQAICMLRGEM